MLDSARSASALQVDIGFGDAVWPQAEEMEYPVALGDPAPLIRAYRPETDVGLSNPVVGK
jgi:hypothetical protein